MTIYAIQMSVSSGRLLSFPSALLAGEGGTGLGLAPLLAFAGFCLVSLLILGGLRLKGRHRTEEFSRGLAPESVAEVAAYDHVTGLPTRRLFGTLLDQAIARAAATGRSLTLFVVELEHFRMVAEAEGPANSNMLVRVQAARVKGVLRSTDTVARLRQDQFAMVADNLTAHEEITAIVEKIQTTVGLPLTLNGHELFLTCRIGVALYPQDAANQTELIEQALRAVKIAKSTGQTVRFVSPPVSSAVHEPLPLAS